MRKSKVFFKKSVALLLSLLVVLTSINTLVIFAQPAEHNHASAVDQNDDNIWSGTTGGLVANNYELNQFEKAILACTGLVGQSYSVKIPADNSEGLVTVDADTQTVTAVPYTTNGFVWEPTAAVIKYNNADGTPGADITVALSKVGENYIANFTKPSNSYRVEVTYSLYIPVDAALQQVLLNAPYYLADGYSLTSDAADNLSLAVGAIEEKIEELRTLYKGIEYVVEYEGKKLYSLVIAIPDGACKDAIGNIIADYDNGNGQLTLGKDIDEYKKPGSSKVQYMMENGAKFKDDINWFYTQIAAINSNSADLLNVAEQLENLANGTGDGTIEGIKALASEKIEAAVQEIIKAAADKASSEYGQYGVDISSLLGKTRKNDAIYNEIENQRVEFEKLAQDAEAMADYYEQAAANWESINPTQAEKYRKDAADYREKANTVRTTGMEALDTLESKIREVYTLGDEKIAEVDGMKSVALDKAAAIREIVNGKTNIGSVVSGVRNINRQNWEYIGKKLVKDDITAAEYAELDKAVMAAVDANGDPLAEEHNDFEIKEKLFAAQTVISAMVDQYVVNIEINANVVPKASIDSASTTSLKVVSTQFPMDKNTSADDVFAAIKASGIEASALGQWDSYYNINSDNYNRTVVILDSKGKEIKDFDALTGDIRYTVTYAPKTLKINETYKTGSEQVTEVPYGYNWRLPRPAELTKSYDYKVNGIPYRENTIIRIVEDIEVSRTEGKAIAAKTLAEIVAASKVPGVQLSEKEKNVLNTNAFLVDTIHFRTPDSNDNLTKIVAVGNGYKLTALPMNAGLLGSDAEWIPVSAYPVLTSGKGSEFAITKNGSTYEAEFECDEIFTSVQVVYQLSIEGLDAATISALANIANDLSADVASQKATLDYLCNENNFYENLGQVNKVILGTLGSVVKNMSPATKDAIDLLTKECIDPDTEKTYLYGYLTQYKSENGGMAYYYKANNAENIRKQIELVNTYLPIVWNDPEVRAAASEYSAGAVAKVDSVLAQLKATDLKPVNALVNTNSSFIDNMLAAVTAAGTTTEHTGITGTVVMETLLSAVAPGQTSFTVEIQVLNKNDGLVSSYKKEMFRKQGNKVTVAEFEAMYNELLAEIPNSKYYIAEKNLPTEDITLGENAVKYTCALRPMSYTVKIEGEADQKLYAFDAYTITLPGTGNAGLKYEYTIGSSKVEVLSGALENFSLTTSIEDLALLFGDDRELVITRKLIDINKANLLTFINNFNNAFANAGLTYGNNLAVAFIPVEDKDGNLSVVLRVTSNFNNLQPASLASEMMALIQDLSYVGINGSPLFGLDSNNELKLYVQTIINMIVNSGLGFDTFANIVDANGNIKEMKINGANAVGSTGNNIVLDNGKVINDANALGGKLIESTMQFGVNVNNATSVPFYVTYQDFDAQADILAMVKKGAEQITPYINISGKDGALNLTLNIPDTAYAYILTALLITGEVDFKTLQTYELDAIIEYMSDLIKPLFEDDKTGYDTFINTIKQTGFFDAIDGFDFEANRAFVEFFYDTFDGLFDSIGSTGSSKGGIYSGELTYNALDVLFNSNVMLEEYKNMVAEVETGVTLPITFKLVNRTTNYEALVLDVFGNGITSKYYMARKAADAIAKAQDGAIVVLLSSVYGNVVFNNDVTLNLNGFSIIGDLTAKGNVTIVDSTLSTKKCGSVIGDLKTNGGSFKIGAGKFLTDVSKYLESGYYLKDGVVSNGCFNIVQNGDDIDIYLGTDYVSLDKSAAKVMATDIIAKLIMNFYSCSELEVDGNGIYETKFINVTESLDDLSVLLNKLIGCFDYAGSTAFATQFMADVTDFGALADAIDNELPLISYTIQQSAFNPHMEYVNDGDYFSFNLTSSEDKKIFNIDVYVSDEVDANHKNKISSILRELDKITTFNALSVDITNISYGKAGFVMEGSAAADVLIDLSTSVDYPVIIAAMLAYDASGAERTKIVNAIKNYQTTNSAKELMGILDAMTVADAFSALENAKSTSFANILAKLGIKSTTAVELESHYTIARKLLGAVIDYANINGVEKALGGIKLSGEYGSYGFRYENSKDTYARLTLKLFSEEKAITVKDKDGIIYLNTDSLIEALNSVKAGSTIYVNRPVELTADVNLPQVAFTIAGSKNINFNGYKFWFLNNKTVLTIDTDISANVACDTAAFCSDITCTKDGDWFIFRLDGEKHEWVIIPAVEPTCGVPGSTEGEQCKHCGTYKEGREPVEIPALEHKYNGVVTPPTCTEEGYTTYTCENCGDTYVNDYTDITNHTIVIIPEKAATCTEDGLTEGSYCSVCGEVFTKQEVIPAGHTSGAYEVPPTCTEPGYTGGTICTVCGEELTAGSLVFPTGHNVAIIEGKPATCTENGHTAGAYCSTCGLVLVDPTPIIAPGHKVVIDEAKAPTCTDIGYTEGSHCENCGEIYVAQQVILPTGHTPEVIPGKPASTTETGLTDGSKCSVCGEILVAPKELAKLPIIYAPTPNVDANGNIRGAKVDVDNKLIYLDVNPDGFTAAEFADVNFNIDNAVVSSVNIYNYNGTFLRNANDLVCTGDKVFVTAKNADGVEATAEYSIVIVGDVNADGKANSRDTVLIKLAFMELITLEGLAINAADVNYDGKFNSRDTVIIESKFVLWPENEYVSQTK